MPAKLLILSAAERDIEEAFEWYERRQAGLGYEFLRSVDTRIGFIQRNPEMCAYAERQYRQALIRRFPYAIFYRHAEDTVTVYAVFHTSQDPKKWRSRLP